MTLLRSIFPSIRANQSFPFSFVAAHHGFVQKALGSPDSRGSPACGASDVDGQNNAAPRTLTRPGAGHAAYHGIHDMFDPLWLLLNSGTTSYYDDDTPSRAMAAVSPAGTAAALSVAGVMAMLLF